MKDAAPFFNVPLKEERRKMTTDNKRIAKTWIETILGRRERVKKDIQYFHENCESGLYNAEGINREERRLAAVESSVQQRETAAIDMLLAEGSDPAIAKAIIADLLIQVQGLTTTSDYLRNEIAALQEDIKH